ncbi:thiosulfohydrolase SoxB, partial [Magnetovibrio sp. PR-2]
KSMGSRISDMTLLSTGEQIDAQKNYVVGGWASVNEGTEGPPIYDLVSDHIRKKKVIDLKPNNSIKVVGA